MSEFIQPEQGITRDSWLEWMQKQRHVLNALRDYYGATSEAAAIHAQVVLGAFTDSEIARACAEGAVCVYLKTREVTK